MNTPATKLLQQALKNVVAPSMLRLGFEGKGRLYRRARNGLLDIVEVQLWKYNDATRARFTLEVGICIPVALEMTASLPSFAYWRDALPNPGITECAIRERVGILMANPHDKWWAISAGTDPVAVACDAVAALETAGIPWLEQFDSMQTFARRLVDKPSVFDIALRVHLGLREEACEAYDKYLVQWGHMQDRVRQVGQWLVG